MASERQLSATVLAEARDAVQEARAAMAALQQLVTTTSSDTKVAMATMQGTVGVIAERVGEMKNQVDDLRNSVRGVGDRPGVIERLVKVEQGLGDIARSSRRRLETIGVWIAAVSAVITAAAWLTSMVLGWQR